MRIRLAILEQDENYLRRLITVFEAKYSDKLEIYSFTDREVALASLNGSKIDIFISDDYFDIPVENIPKRCGFAYLVDSPGVASVKGQCAICKYQKADMIYKQILSLFSEISVSLSGVSYDEGTTKIAVFASPSGGVGNSTMAAAFAIRLASQGQRTLYLNFETFGSSDLFFSSDGGFDMSDVIFAVKSKKVNLAMKLESSVKQDKSGVFFYSHPKFALDMLEFSSEEKIRLISELKKTGVYDRIVIDMDFAVDAAARSIFSQANVLVFVCDGSEASNLKIKRAHGAMRTLDESDDVRLADRICLVYNKFSSKTSSQITEEGLKNPGGAPKFEHASTSYILSQLSGMSMLDNIF